MCVYATCRVGCRGSERRERRVSFFLFFCVPDGGALLGGLAEEEADFLEGLGEGELGGHFWALFWWRGCSNWAARRVRLRGEAGRERERVALYGC